MSVTFSVESPILGWTITCSCGDVRLDGMHETYEAATGALATLKTDLTCSFCADFGDGPRTDAVLLFDDAPSLNVSNANAGTLLRTLGLYDPEGDLTGALSGKTLASRVMEARVLEPQDAGVPASSIGIVIDCGRREGYIQDRLATLLEVANYAWDKDVEVYWG